MEREDGTAAGVTVRRYRDGDAEALCDVFVRSVRDVGPAKYDYAQVQAWAHDVPDATVWGRRMRQNETFVAAREDGAPVGWIELEAVGHVQMLYCAPEVTRRGVAAQLYAAAEALARERGMTVLTADASLFGESFFRKQGWTLDERETVIRFNVVVQRARMSKMLRSN